MEEGKPLDEQPTAPDTVNTKTARYGLRPQCSLHAKLATGILALGSISFFHSHQAHADEFEGPDITDLATLEPVTADFMLLNAWQRQQLWYVQICDSQTEDLTDSDDAQWKVIKVLEHKISKKHRINEEK